MNTEILVTMASAVYMFVEIIKRGLGSMNLDPAFQKVVLLLSSVVLGIVVVAATPGALLIFEGTPLAETRLLGVIVLGGSIGLGSKTIYLLLGLLRGSRNLVDGLQTGAILSDEDRRLLALLDDLKKNGKTSPGPS